MLNQVYANVLNKPVLVPDGTPTSLGSGIVALTTAGVFPSIGAAQQKLCLPFRTFAPEAEAVKRYEVLYQLYRKLYFALGSRNSNPTTLGDVLPQLRHIAHQSKTERLGTPLVPIFPASRTLTPLSKRGHKFGGDKLLITNNLISMAVEAGWSEPLSGRFPLTGKNTGIFLLFCLANDLHIPISS